MKPPAEAEMVTELDLIELENFLVPYEWSYRRQILQDRLARLIAIARAHGYVRSVSPFPPRNGKPEPVPSLQPKNKSKSKNR
jgi:hypothetical protein